MAIFLVDFENVHDSGINGVTQLTENDEVAIFYSLNSEHMSFDTHVSIMQTPARVKYIKLNKSAKNYLDFQLVTHLGYLIGAQFPGPYYIISKDTGYDSVVDYWRDHGVTINRQPSINYNRKKAKNTGQNTPSKTPPAFVVVQENSQVSSAGAKAPQLTVASTEYQIDQKGNDLKQQSVSADISVNESDTNSALDTTVSKDINIPSQNVLELYDVEAEDGQKENKLSESSEIVVSEDQDTVNDSNVSKIADVSKQSEEHTVSADSELSKNSEVDSISDTKAENVSGKSEANTKSENAAGSANDSEKKTEESKVQPVNDSLPESYRKKVRTVLKGKQIPSAHYSAIYKGIVNCYDKSALNNQMVKIFGSTKGGPVYNLIKDIFLEYHSSTQQ